MELRGGTTTPWAERKQELLAGQRMRGGGEWRLEGQRPRTNACGAGCERGGIKRRWPLCACVTALEGDRGLGGLPVRLVSGHG